MKGFWKIVGMVTLAAIIGVAGISSAAAQQPSGDWQALAAGESQWYSFEYAGDGSQIQVRMDVEPQEGAAFSVWTPQQMQRLAAGEEVGPVGRGSLDPFTDCCLVWSGSFGESGTYHIAVEGAGSGTAYYLLEISGDGVWFPEIDESMEVEATEAGVETLVATEAAEAEIAGGTGPDDALPATGGTDYVPLPAGETLWYSFEYAGDGSQIEVWLDAEPDESVTVSIWTGEQVKLWAAGEEIKPVGRGTANACEPGDLFWVGAFGIPGEYYIVVENASSGDASFRLAVTGGDLSP